MSHKSEFISIDIVILYLIWWQRCFLADNLNIIKNK